MCQGAHSADQSFEVRWDGQKSLEGGGLKRSHELAQTRHVKDVDKAGEMRLRRHV